MNKTQLVSIYAVILLSVNFVFAEEFMPLMAMHESGSIVNTTFFNAGGAFPASTSSMSLNPAIPAAWHFYSHSLMSVFGSFYNNNSGNLDFYKTGGGGSLALGMGMYVGLEYLLKSSVVPEEIDIPADRNKFHRATLAFGSMIDDNHEDPLFVGLNLSFYNFDGVGLMDRKSSARIYNKNTNEVYASAIEENDEWFHATNNLVAMDLGFYQPGSGKGLSWGIVLENIFGYSWNEYYPKRKKVSFELDDEDIMYFLGDDFLIPENDTIILETDYYMKEAHKSNNFLSKRYNSFLLGTNISIPIAETRVILMVPADVRFWGFMNKDLRRKSKLKHRTEVHSGLELQLGGKVCGRFGWAWVPEEYATRDNGQVNFKGWDNRFSGGFGVNFGIIALDAVFAKDTWGAGLTFRL